MDIKFKKINLMSTEFLLNFGSVVCIFLLIYFLIVLAYIFN